GDAREALISRLISAEKLANHKLTNPHASMKKLAALALAAAMLVPLARSASTADESAPTAKKATHAEASASASPTPAPEKYHSWWYRIFHRHGKSRPATSPAPARVSGKKRAPKVKPIPTPKPMKSATPAPTSKRGKAKPTPTPAEAAPTP